MAKLEFCRHLKDKYGWQQFQFDNIKKVWLFSDPAIIDDIKNKYLELELCNEAKEDYKRFLINKVSKQIVVEKANQLKVQTESNIVIPGLKGELFPYQKVGVEFLINSKGRAILADAMGLGKSLQALGYIVYSKFEKTLIICPSSVKSSWEQELKKWTKLKYIVIDSKTELDIEIFTKYEAFIINYDILKKHFNFLTSVMWDCCIADEFHYIKNPSAQRTRVAKKIAFRIPNVILLSGTPMLSRPVELFNGLQIMDYNAWPDYYKFTARYCDGHTGHWGWDASGSSNIEELQEKISHYFLRRRKEEVLKDLPPKMFIDVPVELDPENRFKYDLAMSNFEEYLSEVKNKSEVEISNTMRAEKLTLLNELRQITTNGKFEAAAETIQNIIDGDEKVIVFSCYNEPLEQLQEKFKDISVIITGSTPELYRKGAIDSFQNNPKIKIFFGGMKSAGVGITLTEASSVVFIDYSWVPGDHDQAQDRAHRIGQSADKVTIYQLYAENTIDEKMKDILAEKREIFNQLIEQGTVDLESDSSGSIINELVSKLKEKIN